MNWKNRSALDSLQELSVTTDEKTATFECITPFSNLRSAKIVSNSVEKSSTARTVFGSFWTCNKGLRDGADNLDEQETQQCRSLVGTALYVGQDRPETQYATKEAARFISGPTRAAKCMLTRFV